MLFFMSVCKERKPVLRCRCFALTQECVFAKPFEFTHKSFTHAKHFIEYLFFSVQRTIGNEPIIPLVGIGTLDRFRDTAYLKNGNAFGSDLFPPYHMNKHIAQRPLIKCVRKFKVSIFERFDKTQKLTA